MAAEPRDAVRLELIQELIGHIDRRMTGITLASFAADRDEVDLTAYRLAAIGEATNKLSGALKARHPHIPWDAIYGMRNIVSHDYGGVVPERVWNVTGAPLESLAEVCRRELGPD